MKEIRILILILAIAFIFALAHSPPTQAEANQLNDETMIVGTSPASAPQIAARSAPHPADSPPNFSFAVTKIDRTTPNVYHRAIWVDMPPSTSTSSRRHIGRLPGSRARPAYNYVGGSAKTTKHLVLKV